MKSKAQSLCLGKAKDSKAIFVKIEIFMSYNKNPAFNKYELAIFCLPKAVLAVSISLRMPEISTLSATLTDILCSESFSSYSSVFPGFGLRCAESFQLEKKHPGY